MLGFIYKTSVFIGFFVILFGKKAFPKIIISTLALVSLLFVGTLNAQVADEPILHSQIEEYKNENTQIEENLNKTLAIYLQEHKDVVIDSTNDISSLVYISTIPELYDNSYIKQQLSTYYSNKQKINEITDTLRIYEQIKSLIGKN